MRLQLRMMLVLFAVALSALNLGCQDFVITGLTNGISQATTDLIVGLANAVVSGLLGTAG